MITKKKISMLLGILLIVMFPLGSGAFSNGDVVYAQDEVPTLYAEISFDWVDGRNWPLGDYVTLTIEDPDTTLSPDYTDTQIVGTDQLPTYVRFDVWEDDFDLEPGHIVTLTNGLTTKTHTALNIGITNVNMDPNYVEGFAPMGSTLMVTAHTPCWENVFAMADMMTGYWKADFICDLNTVEFIHAEMQGSEEAGVSTGFFWSPPPPPAEPTIQVEINYDWVMGFDWPLGSWVTLTIDDPATTNPMDYFDEKEVVYDEDCWMTSCVRFDFWDDFNVEPGHIVILSDGVTTKDHTAFDIKITEIYTHTVEGLAEPGSELFVMAHEPCWEYARVTADNNGNWIAGFECDLNTVDFVHAAKNDEAGSYTSYFVGEPYVHEVGFWWDEVLAHTHDEIVLRAGWGACTKGLVKAFQKGAHIDITINGEPLYPAGDEMLYWGVIEPFELEGCKAAPSGDQASVAGWRYPLGSLEPGIYEVYVHYWLDHPIIDGGDWDGDGKMDKFDGTLVENTITIVVK